MADKKRVSGVEADLRFALIMIRNTDGSINYDKMIAEQGWTRGTAQSKVSQFRKKHDLPAGAGNTSAPGAPPKKRGRPCKQKSTADDTATATSTAVAAPAVIKKTSATGAGRKRKAQPDDSTADTQTATAVQDPSPKKARGKNVTFSTSPQMVDSSSEDEMLPTLLDDNNETVADNMPPNTHPQTALSDQNLNLANLETLNHDYLVADEALQAAVHSDSYYHQHPGATDSSVDCGINFGGIGSGTFSVPQDDDDGEDMETHTGGENFITSERLEQIMRASGN